MHKIYVAALYSTSFFAGHLFCYFIGITTLHDVLVRSYFMAIAACAVVTTVEKV